MPGGAHRPLFQRTQLFRSKYRRLHSSFIRRSKPIAKPERLDQVGPTLNGACRHAVGPLFIKGRLFGKLCYGMVARARRAAWRLWLTEVVSDTKEWMHSCTLHFSEHLQRSSAAAAVYSSFLLTRPYQAVPIYTSKKVPKQPKIYWDGLRRRGRIYTAAIIPVHRVVGRRVFIDLPSCMARVNRRPDRATLSVSRDRPLPVCLPVVAYIYSHGNDCSRTNYREVLGPLCFWL